MSRVAIQDMEILVPGSSPETAADVLRLSNGKGISSQKQVLC